MFVNERSAIRRLPGARRLRRAGIGIVMVTMLVVTSACGGGEPNADPSAASALEAILQHQGPDREQFLLNGAQGEPTLQYYGDASIYQTTIDAFMKKYPGLKVEGIYLPGTLSARVASEYLAGQNKFDVLDSGPNTIPRDNKLFAKLFTPRANEIAPDLRSDYAVGDLGFGISVNYNPTKVAEADVPTSYAQLADPKYAGKICMANTYIEQQFVGALVKALGIDTVKAIAKNVRTQNTSPRAIADLVISGECPIQLSGVSAHAALSTPDKIRWVPLDPIVGEPRQISISKEAKAPYTAALFVDWVLREDGGQAVFKTFGYGQPFAGKPIAFLPYLPADFGSRKIVYSNSKELIQPYASYEEALKAWAKIVQDNFIAKQ